MIQRVLILSALAFALAYGIIQLQCGYRRKYFIVALCGASALFLSRLYYLVLTVSHGNDSILTVGMLGQASAYLFFTAANLSFISHKFADKLKKQICIPSVVCVAFCFGGLLLPAVYTGTLSAYIGEAIYIASMCADLYPAIACIKYRNEIPACGYVYKFNICVCILIALNVAQEIVLVIASDGIQSTLLTAITVICVPVIALMLPLLKRGMRAWIQ